MAKTIGIDLGTANSCIAVIEGGEPVVIPSAEGARTTPSVVAFSKTGECMVGQVAKYRAITNPERTISSIKREMGSSYKVSIGGKSYTPQEISAIILQKLKADAEAYLSEPVTSAIITAPAYFTDVRRQATKDTGKIAGLDAKRIINEPTAAALSYGIDKGNDQKVMVYDLGGDMFDVSIIEMGDDIQEVLATAGNSRLDGDDFDRCVMDWMIDSFKREAGIDLSGDKMAMQCLKEAAEEAEIELSGMTSASISLPFITVDATGPKRLDLAFSRAKSNELIVGLVEKTMGPVRQALQGSGLQISDISKVLMVGGSSRTPAVQDAVKNLTGKGPFKGINPDECVAVGAALQAGVLDGEVQGLLLLDVTLLSLGVETMGGIMTKIIERNTTIPTKKNQVFSTAADGQTQVEVNVLQGEREFARDNEQPGLFKLDGTALAPRGTPQIEVIFDLDANGIVSISAKDLGTGEEQHTAITLSTNMNKDDTDKAVREAEQFAAEDEKRREEVDIKNEAENLRYSAEKLISDSGDKIEEADKTELSQKVSELKGMLTFASVEELKLRTEGLQKSLYAVPEKLYKANAPQGGAAVAPDMGDQPQEGPAAGDSQTVYDTDFKDVDDSQK